MVDRENSLLIRYSIDVPQHRERQSKLTCFRMVDPFAHD